MAYPLLYHDMLRKYWIWLIPLNSCSNAVGPDELQLTMGTDITRDYTCRVVRDFNSLIEKIKIFDDGLDDRIFEILTTVILYGKGENMPDDMSSLMYYDGSFADPSGRRQFRLASIEPAKASEIPDSYHDIYSEFRPMLPDRNSTLGQWLEIDQKYSLDIMKGFAVMPPTSILIRLSSWFKDMIQLSHILTRYSTRPVG